MYNYIFTSWTAWINNLSVDLVISVREGMAYGVPEVQPSSSTLWARSKSMDASEDNTNMVSVSGGWGFGNARVAWRAAALLLCESFSGHGAGGSPR